MPVHDPTSFTVHVDPDALTRQDLRAAVSRPAVPGPDGNPRPDEHHGASDTRQAARQRAEQARARRAAGAGKTRSYAFRRS